MDPSRLRRWLPRTILYFPKQSLTDGVLTDLYKRALGRFAAPVALPGTIFYCNFRYLVILPSQTLDEMTKLMQLLHFS